jgi:hypothetical protein
MIYFLLKFTQWIVTCTCIEANTFFLYKELETNIFMLLYIPFDYSKKKCSFKK